MNQTQLMERFINGDFDGNIKPIGDLHIQHDGSGGRLVYDGFEIAARRLVWNDEACRWDTDHIIIAEKGRMPTQQYRATNRLLTLMDNLGYRNDGTRATVFNMGHRDMLMEKANVYVHKSRKKEPTMDDVFVKVKPLDEEDWEALVEQGWDAGNGNMTIRRRAGNPNAYAVTILNDDGSVEMAGTVHRNDLIRTMVMYGSFDRHEMFEKKFDHIIIDLGQIDIWDASNIWQIAAFGDVIIS